MQHIGLLGGTFDPIHTGHLHLALTVLNKLRLDEVRLIPCYQTVHRPQAIATPKQRLKMTNLACEAYTHIICDDLEFKREGKSYMIDTLQTIKQAQTNTYLYLIIGYDAFMHFTSWKNWQDILELANLIVAKRPNYNNQQNECTQLLIQQYGIDFPAITSSRNGKISVLEINALNISASTIRENIKNHRDVSDVLPDNVYQFIKQEGLYGN